MSEALKFVKTQHQGSEYHKNRESRHSLIGIGEHTEQELGGWRACTLTLKLKSLELKLTAVHAYYCLEHYGGDLAHIARFTPRTSG